MYAIHVRDGLEQKAGFLGTADDLHLTTDVRHVRRFATMAEASATMRRLQSTPHHFLRESRHYRAMVAQFDR